MTHRGDRAHIQVGLGANLGNRTETIERAFDALDDVPGTDVIARSSLYRTEPRIVRDQPEFVNACATIETALEPRNLLETLLRIETTFGRRRTREKGPRRLDLDILLWGSRVVDCERLTIPHPGLTERAFVLVPLVEIAPEARDPRSGETIRTLLDKCEDEGKIERIGAQG